MIITFDNKMTIKTVIIILNNNCFTYTMLWEFVFRFHTRSAVVRTIRNGTCVTYIVIVLFLSTVFRVPNAMFFDGLQIPLDTIRIIISIQSVVN